MVHSSILSFALVTHYLIFFFYSTFFIFNCSIFFLFFSSSVPWFLRCEFCVCVYVLHCLFLTPNVSFWFSLSLSNLSSSQKKNTFRCYIPVYFHCDIAQSIAHVSEGMADIKTTIKMSFCVKLHKNKRKQAHRQALRVFWDRKSIGNSLLIKNKTKQKSNNKKEEQYVFSKLCCHILCACMCIELVLHGVLFFICLFDLTHTLNFWFIIRFCFRSFLSLFI